MQSKLRYALTIAALTSLGLAGTAAAGDDYSKSPKPEPEASQGSAHSSDHSAHNDYSKLDQNSDGALTRAEAAKNKLLVQQWASLDTNNDGKLDQAEFSKFETSPAKDPKSATP